MTQPRIWAYRRPNTGRSAGHDLEGQRLAIKSIATLQGLQIDNGSWREEISANDDVTVNVLLGPSGAQSGDILLIASPSTLSHKPSRMLDLIGQFLAKNVRIVAASCPGGVIPLDALRAVMEPLTAAEDEIAGLKTQIVELEDEHQRSFADFEKALTEKVLGDLKARGLSLAQILRPNASLETAESDVPRPDEGKRLRAMRESLGFSQEFAGGLLDKKIDKGAVSKAEAFGSGAAHYQDLLNALNIEIGLKQAREIKRSQGIADAVKRPQKAEQVIKKAVAEASQSPWEEIAVDAKAVALARQRNLEARI